jgi:adenosine deaminase
MLTSGAQCSINTDDELLFNTCLTKELHTLEQNGIIGFVDILKLQQNAASAAFIDASERKRMIDNLATAWANFVNDKEP